MFSNVFLLWNLILGEPNANVHFWSNKVSKSFHLPPKGTLLNINALHIDESRSPAQQWKLTDSTFWSSEQFCRNEASNVKKGQDDYSVMHLEMPAMKLIANLIILTSFWTFLPHILWIDNWLLLWSFLTIFRLKLIDYYFFSRK